MPTRVERAASIPSIRKVHTLYPLVRVSFLVAICYSQVSSLGAEPCVEVHNSYCQNCDDFVVHHAINLFSIILYVFNIDNSI